MVDLSIKEQMRIAFNIMIITFTLSWLQTMAGNPFIDEGSETVVLHTDRDHPDPVPGARLIVSPDATDADRELAQSIAGA